ncbi:MAG TPA: hypothetical protein VK136_06785 [Bacillota bacterium]|nr:hypothetical protein [Bacillota bacterium]
MNKKSKALEVLMWSIALPGFGQLLNRKWIKGIILIILEFVINVLGNFNWIIILSYHGKIQEAIAETNYLWLMFYPCLYFFAIWDAYKDAGGGRKPFAFLPFVFSAYMTTIGLIFSADFKLFGVFIGPIWLPILSLPVGLALGAGIRWLLLKKYKKNKPL